MGSTRRKMLTSIGAALGGMVGLTQSAGPEHEGTTALDDAYTELYSRGVDGAAEVLLALDERTDGNPYRQVYDGELPTSDNDVITDMTGVSDEPEQLIQADDAYVEQYADALDVDGIRGRYGDLDFGELELPAYRSGMEQFGRTYNREPAEFFEDGEGNCVDYAIALSSIMEHQGYDSRVVLGAVRHPSGDPGMHAIAETDLDTGTYVFDTMNGGSYVARDGYEDLDAVSQWAPATMFGTDTPYQFYDPDWDR